MHITISRDEFRRAVTGAASVVPANPTLPAIRHLLIRAEGGRVSFMGGDLDNTVSITVPTEREERAGAVCLPADKLSAIAKEAQGPVTIDAGGEGPTTIASRPHRWKVGSLPAVDYPLPEDFTATGAWRMDGSELERLSAMTAFAAADPKQPSKLVNTLVELRMDSARAVATNTRILAAVQAEAEGDTEADVVLPPGNLARAASLVSGLPITLEAGANHMRVSADGIAITLRMAESDYPHWRQIIRLQSASAFRFSRTEMLSAIRALEVMSLPVMRLLSVRFGGSAALLNLATADGQADSGVQGEYVGEPVTLGINAPDALSVLAKAPAERLEWRMTLPTQAVHVGPAPETGAPVAEEADPAWFYMIMPQRLP